MFDVRIVRILEQLAAIIQCRLSFLSLITYSINTSLYVKNDSLVSSLIHSFMRRSSILVHRIYRQAFNVMISYSFIFQVSPLTTILYIFVLFYIVRLQFVEIKERERRLKLVILCHTLHTFSVFLIPFRAHAYTHTDTLKTSTIIVYSWSFLF